MQRVKDADLSYPILVIFNKGRWVVLDGIHRLVKAYMSKDPVIRVRILSKKNGYLKISETESDYI